MPAVTAEAMKSWCEKILLGREAAPSVRRAD